MQEAKEAAEKLLKDIAKVLPSLNSHPDLKLESKDAFQILTTNANTVSNILVWQELPDGPMTKKNMDEFMVNISKSTAKAYEKMEQIKATLKARGK